MLQKKGQAAMEFLMTYGWAILAAVIAISILIYFGVFGGGSVTGNVILISQPFHTTSSQVVLTTSSANFDIINKGGSNLQISSMTITGTGSSAGITCTNNNPLSLLADESSTVNLPCIGTLEVGEPFTGDILIRYTVRGLSITQSAGGTIQTTVQV